MNGDINLMPRVDTLPIKIKQEYRRWRMIWSVATIVAVSFLIIAAHRRHQIENRVDSIATVAADLELETDQYLANETYLATIRQELSQSSPVPSGVDLFTVLDLLVSAVESVRGEDGSRAIQIDRLHVVPSEIDGDVLVEIAGSARDRRAVAMLSEALARGFNVTSLDRTTSEPPAAYADHAHPFLVRFVLPKTAGSMADEPSHQDLREAT